MRKGFVNGAPLHVRCSTFAPDLAIPMERLRLKNLLLACTVLLGLQFCFPVSAWAEQGNPVAALATIGMKKVESECDHASLPLIAPIAVTARVPQVQGLVLLASCTRDDDRDGGSLLPVTGLYPSAP